MCQVDRGGSIDPALYRDQAGTWWLTWKSDDNAIGGLPHIWSQRLSASGSERVGPIYDLLAADQPWEEGIIEGPSMTDHRGKVLLFYGSGWFESWQPSIGYAVCESPAGPCTKASGPWMSSESAEVAAPSGPSLVTASNGTTILAFHTWAGAVGYARGGRRVPSIEPLDLSGSVPRLRPDRPRGGPIDPDLLWFARSSLSAGAPDVAVEYGAVGNWPLTGDWNGDGTTDIGVYANGWWYLRDSLTPGPPDHTINYGTTEYWPLTGDWNGDGTTDIGVFANGWWYLRDSLTPGPPDHTINYGTTEYWPLTGDWNGDGTTDIGVFANGWWYLRDSLTPGPPDHTINYGTTGYWPLTGDWNGDGTTDIGVFANGWWYLRDSLTPGRPDHTINYGAAGYRPITGSWSGGGDGIAVVVPH